MNPDVPSLEVCKRLNWPSPANDNSGAVWWWRVSGLGTGTAYLSKWRLQFTKRARPGTTYTRAPTIGEMLAEIRRRGWQGWVGTEGFAVITIYDPDNDDIPRDIGTAGPHTPADALANALAEAKEWAAGKK